jgi:hypothetical protein
MTASLHTAHLQQNRILACLPSKERKTLKEAFELVSLYTKEELNEVNTPIRYLHFPVGSAISLIDSEPGGGSVEVAVVGMEGCTGSTVVQGASQTNTCPQSHSMPLLERSNQRPPTRGSMIAVWAGAAPM